MTEAILLRETRGHIRILTINRPERSNAMSPELTDELIEAFVDGGADPDIRVIVLTAVGDRAFCAGADLKARAQADAAGRAFQPLLSRVQRYIFEVVYETVKPTIAALNGPAVAGGLELALACDIRVAAEHALMGLPEAKRGKGAHFANVHAAAHGAARHRLRDAVSGRIYRHGGSEALGHGQSRGAARARR